MLSGRAPVQAYTPIVAAGKAGAVLHYIKNNASFVHSNELMLVDAACELNCYASDVRNVVIQKITRTWPLNGTQRLIKKASLQEIGKQFMKLYWLLKRLF